MSEQSQSLTGGHLLARNVTLNFVGWTLPALAGVVAIPVLVRTLGDARFGILALAWTLIGYFSLFDLGIGRALTHAVAYRLGRDQREDVGSVLWTALAVMFPVGAIGALALIFLAPWLVGILKIPAGLELEAVSAFRVVAISIPFVGATAALRGMLEATQRFGWVNGLRIPHGLLTFVGPLAALPFSHSLVPAMIVLTVGRIVLCLAHGAACYRVTPDLMRGAFAPGMLRSLVTYGGWMTVSNIVSPIMASLDRFVIGAVLSVALVTYYATPHELVTKMWLFTAAVWPVFFPAFATSAAKDPERAALLFDRALRITFAALLLPTMSLVVLSHEILTLWLGPTFAAQSAGLMQILAIAVFVNCLGQGAYTLIQGIGRPDLTGKYHLIELPVYAALLWALMPRYGLMGVAIAWAVRAVADAFVLLLTCPVVLPGSAGAIRRTLLWLAAALPVMIIGIAIQSTAWRMGIAISLVPVWALLAWRWMLTDAERTAPLLMINGGLLKRST